MESLILLLFLTVDAAVILSVMYFLPLKQQDCFLLVVIIVGNWKLFTLPFHQHPFCFTKQSVLLFLKVDSVCSFQAILFSFLAYIIFDYLMKEKRQNTDLTGIQSIFIPLSHTLLFFSFFLPSGTIVFIRCQLHFLLFRIPKYLCLFKLAVSWC